MGLSLVACSSNEPKTKVAEEKEEKKIINSCLEATLMKSPIIKQSVIFLYHL